MAKKFSRRDFLKGTSLVVAGGVLAACAPQATATVAPTQAEVKPTEAPAQPSGGKTITYWHQWGGAYPEKAWPAMMALPEWKEYLGDTTVEVKVPVAEEALLTAIAGGTPPDSAANYNYLDYMARGVLRPVDDYVATSKHIKKEDFIEGNWNLGMYEGKLYGIPACEGFVRYGTNYNKKMVADAGLDPTKPPETWDEWLDWHTKLTKFDSAKNLIQIGLDPIDAMGESLWTTDGWLWQTSWNVDNWFDPNTKKFNLNNDQMVDYFNTTKKFIDVVGIDNLTGLRQVQGQGSWGGSYNAQVQAVIIEGYWHPGETFAEKPEVSPLNMATWAPVPASRKGKKIQLAGGHLIMTFKESKNPDLVYAMTELHNNAKVTDAIFKNVGWLPAIKTYLDSVDPSIFPGLDFYFKSVKEANEWHAPVACPITSFVANTFVEDREKVYRGEMKPEDAAADLQKRCEDEYKAAGFGS